MTFLGSAVRNDETTDGMGTLVISHKEGVSLRLNVNGGDWTPMASTETEDTYFVLQGGTFYVFEGNKPVFRFFNEEQTGFYVREVDPEVIQIGEKAQVTLSGDGLNVYGEEVPVVYWSNDNNNPTKYPLASSAIQDYQASENEITFKVTISLSTSQRTYIGALKFGNTFAWINNSRPL